VLRVFCRLFFLMALAVNATTPADPPLVPVSVCEVVRDLSAHNGKNIAVLGRYSFRENGRWLGEQACDPPVESAAQLTLVEDSNVGPRPPESFELDGVELQKKFTDMRRRTELGKFRFGSPDYDRWAVVFGQVRPRTGEEAKKSPAMLVFRGDGVVIFLRP
jgi:hypothetical protein